MKTPFNPKSEIRNPKLKAARLGFGGGILALLASATLAFAQSNGVPGAADYPSFSRFITERNIFDPDRQPHYTTNVRRTRSRTRTAPPGIQLVGTMSYEKGLFAFFNANSSAERKALQPGENIAGYTVTAIEPASVALESMDKKQQLKLGIGDGLRQENGKWVVSRSGETTVDNSAPAAESPASADSSDAGSTPSAPPSASAPNDTLKRLMEQREKENQ